MNLKRRKISVSKAIVRQPPEGVKIGMYNKVRTIQLVKIQHGESLAVLATKGVR